MSFHGGGLLLAIIAFIVVWVYLKKKGTVA